LSQHHLSIARVIDGRLSAVDVTVRHSRLLVGEFSGSLGRVLGHGCTTSSTRWDPIVLVASHCYRRPGQ
jgi:hypothetical protein